VDPLSLTALSAAVLTQGIGFLYGQVGELLRRRQDRRQADVPGAAEAPVGIPTAGEAEQVLVGELTPGPVDDRALEDHAERLARLRGLLSPYAEGHLPVDPGDGQLREQVEALRSLLEQIYRQHITFHGERRPASGTPLGVQTGDLGRYATEVIASGERAVAVGGDAHNVNTGNHNSPR
jgi:hypothetical protein